MKTLKTKTDYDGERVRVNGVLGTVIHGWKDAEPKPRIEGIPQPYPLMGVTVKLDNGLFVDVLIKIHLDWIAGEMEEGVRTLSPPNAVLERGTE